MRERTIKRYLDKYLKEMREMVFISGPRQVGKTVLATSYGKEQGGCVYFNWDVVTDQKKLAKNPYFFEEENRTPFNIVVFDEIHKYARWKNYLKGAYDKYKDDFLFIVTGSGRLDLFKKGGDSLLGRYFSLPLFPFTLSELSLRFPAFGEFKRYLQEGPPSVSINTDEYEALFEFGGFPQPLLKGERSFYNIWQQERKTLLLREDIRDATNIREISLLEMLSHIIVEKISSPLSINALRQDIGVAFETARDWVNLLSQFYYLFQIRPFTGSLKRTLRKETKAYLFDWAEISSLPVRFENFVASHLLKAVKTWKSIGEGNLKLHYIRDKEKREVDFLIAENLKPVCLIEAKIGEENISKDLLFYQEKLKVPVAIQLLNKSGVEKRMKINGRLQWIVSANKWLNCLP
jgi:predicted AAA+ superfamily ATPase